MPRRDPYLVLLDPADPAHSFAYRQAPDGVSVSVTCVEPAGLGTLGPWPREIADRHARQLRAAGYLAYVPSQDLAAMQTGPTHALPLTEP
jgi:hypothetical protein